MALLCPSHVWDLNWKDSKGWAWNCLEAPSLVHLALCSVETTDQTFYPWSLLVAWAS